MNYFKQILYELKNQKMVTWVSISGTALAIFLIMSVFMSDRIQNVVMTPESQRDRILIGKNIHLQHPEGSGSTGGVSYELANKLYGNLDGVENISLVATQWGTSDIGLQGEKTISVQPLQVDNAYWNIYDYKFIAGTPFEKEEIEAGLKIVILTESVARKIFGETAITGRQVDIDNQPYLVKGVVKDSNPLLTDGTIDIFTTYKKDQVFGWQGDIAGSSNVRLLLKDGVEADYIKSQVKKRYEDWNREMQKSGYRLIYHQQPYTSEEISAGTSGSNNDPQLEFETRIRGAFYLILLILPAINLSSMTRSRLRHRISEIGVRRAFGAKKKNIISQIFTENLLISLIGGAIGLGLSLIFLAFLSQFFISFTNPHIFSDIITVNLSPVIWRVFDFRTFFIAFGACFVLNILSATLPAWRASIVNPAIAISKAK